MQQLSFILLFFTVILNLSYAEDGKWIWLKSKNQKVRGYYPEANKKVYYTEDQYARAERDREPTTKRPIPGQQQSDDIDDYADLNEKPVKQNSPYIPNGGFPNGENPGFGGQFNGFNNFPQIGGGYPGNTANGILVGPGGPTGIIGRPQPQYPSGLGPATFPGGQAGYPGYPDPSFNNQNFAGVGANGNPGYPGPSFNPQNFPGAGVNGNPGFPSYNGLGQYPGPPNYSNTQQQQFAGAQYPQTQYPQSQYPGVQYPSNQFTEGYGLANLNPGFNSNPPSNFNGYPNYGQGYDEYPSRVEDKSASVKSINKTVDDKVSKTLKKL